ncbi:MAG: SpoIIE family protein phosphatase [Tissierellia bacterium]|nr:SpoIIE family protein phosphatase [Tissierellia bacterium]
MLIDEGRLRIVLGGLGDQILNGIADFVRVVNKDNEVVFINDAMKEVLGGDPEKLTCAVPFDSCFLCNPLITLRSLQTGEIIQREESYQQDTYSVKTSPIWGDEGKIVGAVEVYRNKSREKKLQMELIEKNRIATKEMAQAKNIQHSLLPKKGFYGNVKVNHIYIPSDVISGDMLDVFQINEDVLGFYMSDTVGHGFASGMTTLFIRETLRNLSYRELMIPSRTLEEIHRKFNSLGLDIEIYFTIFYGVYNKRENRLYFSNGGHNCAPIKITSEGCTPIKITGRPISRIFEKSSYEDFFIDIHCGDRFLLYTDGITESKNEKQENFGLERLIALGNQYKVDLLENILDYRNQFTWGDQKDDISALLLDIY